MLESPLSVSSPHKLIKYKSDQNITVTLEAVRSQKVLSCHMYVS